MTVEHKESRSVLTHSKAGSSAGTVADGFRSDCTCGAHWTHPLRRSDEEMESIFQSHVRYFDNKTLVL